MACSEVESNTSGITEGRLCGLSGTTGTGEVNSLDHRMHFQERGRLHKPAPQGQAGATNLKQHSEDSFTSTYGSAYTCVTQHACQISIRALSLNVIGPGNLIARWAHGSRLSYFVSSKGLSNVLLERIKTGMRGASEHWRTTSINISFEETYSKTDAVFLVELDSELDASIFAKSFFPGDARQVLDISPVMLEDKHENHIANILCHELGHVLGLRHEFRHLVEPNVYHYPAPAFDHQSIMNCENVKDLSNFTLSHLDRINTHRFYDLPAGSHHGFSIMDYIPQTGKFGTTKGQVTWEGHTFTEEEASEDEEQRWLYHRSRNWSRWYHDGADVFIHLGISYPGVAWDASSPYQTR
jgi:hypothetical protein